MFWKLGTLRIKLNQDTLFKIQLLRIKYGVRRISNSSLASVGEMTAILMNLLKLHTHTHTRTQETFPQAIYSLLVTGAVM